MAQECLWGHSGCAQPISVNKMSPNQCELSLNESRLSAPLLWRMQPCRCKYWIYWSEANSTAMYHFLHACFLFSPSSTIPTLFIHPTPAEAAQLPVAPRYKDSPPAYTHTISSLPATAVTFRTSRELHLRGCVSTASTYRHHPPLAHLQKGSDGKHEVDWENQSFLKAQILLPTLEKSLFFGFFCMLMLNYL